MVKGLLEAIGIVKYLKSRDSPPSKHGKTLTIGKLLVNHKTDEQPSLIEPTSSPLRNDSYNQCPSIEFLPPPR